MTPDPSVAFAAARAQMAGPLVRGRVDCLFAACATSSMLFGRDPLASGRPDYGTFTAALRIARAAGGWLPWADAAFTTSGMVRVASPAPGDLCLAVTPRARAGLTFGICVQGDEVAAKADPGLFVAPMAIKGAWTWG